MMEPTISGATRRGGRAVPRGAMDADAASDSTMEALVARIERLESERGLRERGRSMLNRVMPPEAATHFRNAGREQLLAVRAIVDFWIDRVDESERRAGRDRSAVRETIEIE
jgi:hypothetical protein